MFLLNAIVTWIVLATIVLSLKSYNRAFEYFKQRFNAWVYLFNGPSMIQEGYVKSNGNPFEVFTPDTRYVFVSSARHINELDDAPDSVLSLQAAAKQMLQPKYTMHGFNWFDLRGTEGLGFVKAIRTLLTNQVTSILPELRRVTTDNFRDIHATHKMVNAIGGSKHSPVYPLAVQLNVIASSFAFFGEEIASNKEFRESSVNYILNTYFTAEILRLLPEFIVRTIGKKISQKSSSPKHIYETLLRVVEQRLLEKEQRNRGLNVLKHSNLMQWIIETVPKKAPWTAERIVYELMAIWFGSIHTLGVTTTYAIRSLCLHPEYIEPLRREVQGPEYDVFENTGQGLPLLDSFIRESSRLSPIDAMSTRRQALQPFTLSDGTKLEVGDWACTPAQAMVLNPQHYPEPLEFQGFRFVDPALLSPDVSHYTRPTRASKFVDMDESWQIWGTGRMACPGRYYASALLKVLLAQIIRNYNCELVNKQSSPSWIWRSTFYPKTNTTIFTPLSRDLNA